MKFRNAGLSEAGYHQLLIQFYSLSRSPGVRLYIDCFPVDDVAHVRDITSAILLSGTDEAKVTFGLY